MSKKWCHFGKDPWTQYLEAQEAMETLTRRPTPIEKWLYDKFRNKDKQDGESRRLIIMTNAGDGDRR